MFLKSGREHLHVVQVCESGFATEVREHGVHDPPGRCSCHVNFKWHYLELMQPIGHDEGRLFLVGFVKFDLPVAAL